MNNANVDAIVYPTWSDPPRLIGEYYSADGKALLAFPLRAYFTSHCSALQHPTINLGTELFSTKSYTKHEKG